MNTLISLQNLVGYICEKLLSDPYVLLLVTAAKFYFDGSKIRTSVLCRITQRTFIPSLVPIGPVVSGDKSFEKLLRTTDDDEDGFQVMAIAHMVFSQVS